MPSSSGQSGGGIVTRGGSGGSTDSSAESKDSSPLQRRRLDHERLRRLDRLGGADAAERLLLKFAPHQPGERVTPVAGVPAPTRSLHCDRARKSHGGNANRKTPARRLTMALWDGHAQATPMKERNARSIQTQPRNHHRSRAVRSRSGTTVLDPNGPIGIALFGVAAAAAVYLSALPSGTRFGGSRRRVPSRCLVAP
jgi:hypothetical protein